MYIKGRMPFQYLRKGDGGREKESALSEQREARQAGEEDLRDVRCCLSGDGEGYRRLIERNQGRVSSIMWRFSRDADTHEDLVQEVFVEAYEGLSGYQGKAPFAHWLARIAVRVGYHHWKREKRERALEVVPLEEWHEALEAPEEEMEPSEAGELLHLLMGQLPPRDRLVLTLRFIEGHSVEKTAELTGWSRSLVKVQTWRARNKLRKLFERERREVD